VKVVLCVCATGVVLSVTFSVTVGEPDEVGVPTRLHVPLWRASPAGAFVWAHVYGAVPPVILRSLPKVYGMFTMPCGTFSTVITIVETGFTVRVYSTVLLVRPVVSSLTARVNGTELVEAGVPVIDTELPPPELRVVSCLQE
jgi:hypothetical protein